MLLLMPRAVLSEEQLVSSSPCCISVWIPVVYRRSLFSPVELHLINDEDQLDCSQMRLIKALSSEKAKTQASRGFIPSQEKTMLELLFVFLGVTVAAPGGGCLIRPDTGN